MENPKQLASRFREVTLNGKWIANTNYINQLSDINWKQATIKIGSLNTIAALTFHTNYYITGILNVFEDGTLDIRDKYSFDMPPINSEEDWAMLLKDLESNAKKFATHVEGMSDKN